MKLELWLGVILLCLFLLGFAALLYETAALRRAVRQGNQRRKITRAWAFASGWALAADDARRFVADARTNTHEGNPPAPRGGEKVGQVFPGGIDCGRALQILNSLSRSHSAATSLRAATSEQRLRPL